MCPNETHPFLVRTVKFIVRMSWFICGTDDMCCRVYNFNTMEKVKVFEAHQGVLLRGFLDSPSAVFTLVFLHSFSMFLPKSSFHLFSPDYIRSLAVHETLPYVLTSSDDMTVKLWDWSKGWQNTMVCVFSSIPPSLLSAVLKVGNGPKVDVNS